MEAENILSQSIDKSQVPPLHQKRILAFINHFLINSSQFLNEFAVKCESKFIELERKMQRVEAALTIIEAKLASIPDTIPESIARKAALDNAKPNEQTDVETDSTPENKNSALPFISNETNSVRACEDVRYKKFFKMLQFGVPAAAVKMKMQAEGMEPNILDTPNMLLACETTC